MTPSEVESRTQRLKPRPRTQKKKIRGQGKGQTDFSRTDPLEAKDKNDRGQERGHNFSKQWLVNSP